MTLHIDTSFSLYWYIGKLKRISIHSETSCNRLLKPNWIQQQTHVEQYCDFSLIWLKLNAMAAIFEDVSSVFLWLNKINVYQRNVEKCSTQPNHRDLQVEKRQTKTEPGTHRHTPGSTGVWSRLSNHFVIRIQHNRTHAHRLPCAAHGRSRASLHNWQMKMSEMCEKCENVSFV